MRSTVLRCLLATSLLCLRAAAGGERGAADKILFYYAYLAEEILGPPYTIGVGCESALPFSRCNFNEFLAHIIGDPKLQKLLPVSVQGADDVTHQTMNNLKLQIEKWPSRDTFPRFVSKNAGILTHGVVNTRVSAGAVDYYDALEKSGAPVGRLGKLADPEAQRLADLGKLASQINYDLRSKDFQKFQLAAVKMLLKRNDPAHADFDISEVPSRNTLGMSDHKLFDYSGTLELNAHRPGFQNELDTALYQWEAEAFARDGPTNKVTAHKRALSAARRAEVACFCLP